MRQLSYRERVSIVVFMGGRQVTYSCHRRNFVVRHSLGFNQVRELEPILCKDKVNSDRVWKLD